jgi:hypothetical protein
VSDRLVGRGQSEGRARWVGRRPGPPAAGPGRRPGPRLGPSCDRGQTVLQLLVGGVDPLADRAAVSETVLVSFLRQGEMLKKVSRPEMAAHSPVQYQRVAASTTVCSPSTSRPPRAAATPMRSRPAGRTGFGCPRRAMRLPTPADRRTTSSRPGAPTSPRPLLLRNLDPPLDVPAARPWIGAELNPCAARARSQTAT